MLRRYVSIIKKYGFINCIKGAICYIRNYMLRKIFKFEYWHVTPIYFRQYATDIFKEVNMCTDNNLTVEVGCGLGDILHNILANKKVGYDISENVLRCGRILYKDIEFNKGSFSDICNLQIDVLVMVNFIHNIEPEELRQAIYKMVHSNTIKMIVLDRIVNSENSNYKYSHDIEFFFKDLPYRRMKQMGGYVASGNAQRIIEFWKCI